ncbi:Vacuolar import and degradation protein 27 [Komagataella phaffii CBS 7435]|uniref:Vacuolar import and degradation protein 27 n=2 Tax=Komagataella phaffii TaxID=460519 RepID=C4R330_KOMPG|nr:Cytoplasmic protein of unknown function [Komagataella phaffii GS115]AOA62352.1 GQ67_01325T0 [Komagataella phaffii]CAH2447533.1 Vacuolar import and degradation protein 27 [Komagataella phaffii CBS 7435]AOA67769.1 GQ68_00065T0 [Komagataella phaffii GS115]CAY69904.1 Cytoplasmic protein of unknown function [Komagataella phaffii GS115]CCA37728.1 Vacuolar import and degradation protein 27 [Komagataella phaffii CBS 7435]
MNIIKKFFGSSPRDELIMIPLGKLFLVRSIQSPKGESECLYNDVVASIRRTSLLHNYQLVLNKAYEEGNDLSDDEELTGNDYSELEDVNNEEWSFLIDQNLQFDKLYEDNSWQITWNDLNGDPGDKFHFICDESVDETLVDQFMQTLYKCQYERKYKKDSSTVSLDSLKEFIVKHETAFESDDAKGASENQEKDEDDEEEFHDVIDDDEEFFNSQILKGNELYTVTGDLRLYDPNDSVFKLKAADAIVRIVSPKAFTYYLNVKNTDLLIKIDSDLNPVFNFEHTSFIFSDLSSSKPASWLIKFRSYDDLSQFQSQLMKYLWETLNQSEWLPKQNADKDYMIEAFQAMDIDSSEEDEKDEERDESEEYESEDESDTDRAGTSIRRREVKGFSDDDQDYNDYDPSLKKQPKRANLHNINKELKVGIKNDRSYVSRGDKLGVFKTTDDGLQFYTAIENLKTIKGKELAPQKMMLHEGDKAMIIQDPTQQDTLYKMDLEYGKVVEEWRGREDLDLEDFGPTTKYATISGEPTFLGVSEESMFKLDPRLSGDKLVKSEFNVYRKNPKFTALATTENGYVAVGSATGEIRLYNRVGINAKTQLPGLGEPIIGIDLSNDGRWILATCKTYLLLVDTKVKGDNSGSYYTKSYGKDNKPHPKILQLAPEHVAFIKMQTGAGLSFTKAHFNNGLDSKAQTIVSSTGPYLVSWSLRKLQKGDSHPYLIKKYDSKVIADNFKFGTDKDIILATTDDVTMVNKKSFKKPTKDSIVSTAF